MPERAAIVTGASRGIGLALAETLADEGYALTVSARKPDTLEAAAEVVGRHRERFGRLDVLVNNAGVGIGATATEHQTKHIDLQLAVNLRAIVLFYRESIELLRATATEDHNALVVNLASLAGKAPQPWLSVYSATKAAVVSYTVAMNKELANDGIKSVALCPGFVDTDMADFIKETIPAEAMLKTSDIAEALRFLLRVSPACVISEIVFQRPGETF